MVECEICKKLMTISEVESMEVDSQDTTQSVLGSQIAKWQKQGKIHFCWNCRYPNVLDFDIRNKLDLDQHPGIYVNHLQLVIITHKLSILKSNFSDYRVSIFQEFQRLKKEIASHGSGNLFFSHILNTEVEAKKFRRRGKTIEAKIPQDTDVIWHYLLLKELLELIHNQQDLDYFYKETHTTFTQYDYDTLEYLMNQFDLEYPEFQRTKTNVLHFAKEFALNPIQTFGHKESFETETIVTAFLDSQFHQENKRLQNISTSIDRYVDSIQSQLQYTLTRIDEPKRVSSKSINEM